MVVLGASGTGKTVLAISLVVGIIRQNSPSGHNAGNPVPVLFGLSSWDPSEVEVADWMESQLAERFRLSNNVSSRLVRDGWILPVLDGLDEMDSSDSGRRRSTLAVERINQYIASAPYPRMVIISRSDPKLYESLTRKLRDFVEIRLEPLDSKQIITYVNLQCPDEGDHHAWQPVFSGLRGANNSEIRRALGTPWRLTAAVAFYMDGGNPADLVPRRDELGAMKQDRLNPISYSERVRDLLIEAFIVAKTRLYRRRGVTPTVSLAWLRLVAERLDKGENASDNELVLHDWWKALDRRKVVLWQTICTWFITVHLPWLVIWIFGVPNSAKANGLFAVFAVISNSITIAMFAVLRSQRQVGPRDIRLRSLSDPRRLVMVTVVLLVSAAIGYVGVIAFSMLDGLALGFACALAGVLTSATSMLPAHAVRPRNVLLGDRNYHIVLGIGFAAYAYAYYVSLYGTTYAFMLATEVFIGWVFSSAYMRYIATVIYGHRYGFPLAFAGFLDWAHRAGILRSSGIGYQFRHQELLDYLRSS